MQPSPEQPTQELSPNLNPRDSSPNDTSPNQYLDEHHDDSFDSPNRHESPSTQKSTPKQSKSNRRRSQHSPASSTDQQHMDLFSGEDPSHLSIDRIQQTKARLEAQRIECEERGKYKQAQLIHDKLRQLSLLEGNKIATQVQSNHKKMQNELVNQQTIEVDTFESVWDMKLEEYDRKAKEILIATIDRQRWEQKETEQHVRAQLMMKKPKFSKQVLQLRHVLKQYVKSKHYHLAEQTRAQIKPLELKEMEKFQKEQEETLKRKMEFVHKQHEHELEALKQRIQQGKNELLAQRRQDWKRLSQHHTNMMTEVTQKQRRILSTTKRIISTHSTVLMSSPSKSNVDYQSTFASLQPTPGTERESLGAQQPPARTSRSPKSSKKTKNRRSYGAY